MPGIGTVLGGALGGFLGGFGGSAAEQKVRDDHIDWGKAGVEGLFSAVPGGAGKSARVAATAGRDIAEQAGKDTLTGDVKQLFTPQPGIITDRIRGAADNTRAFSNGARTGARIQGRTDRLQPNEVADVRDFLHQVGAKGTAENQLKTVQDVEKNAADSINTIVSNNAKPVTPEDLYGAQNRIRDRIIGQNGEGVGGFDVATHGPIAERYAQQMANIKDSQGWLNFKRSLDDDINYARNSQSIDPKVEQIAKMFRQEANDQLGNLHPEVVPWNKMYSRAQDAKNVLVLNADPRGVATGLLSVNGRGVGGKQVQGGVDAAGRLIQGGANIASTPAATQFGSQLASSGLHNLFGSQQPGGDQLADPNQQGDQLPFDNPQSMDEAILNEAMSSGITDFDGLSKALSGGTMPQTPGATQGAPGGAGGLQYSSTDLTNAAMKALAAGDLNAYKQLSDAAGLVGDQEAAIAKQQAAAGGDGLNVTKVTAQQYGLAQSGASATQELKQLLASDPTALTRSATPGRNLPIVGGFISNAAGTGNLDAIGYNIADSILRLRTGATANEGEVRKLQAQIMPRAGDSKQTIQTKMQQIDQIFGGVLNLAGNSSTSSPMDELGQLFAQQGQNAY